MGKIRNFWKSLGPGLIVGAVDDDPVAITIYALAGAKFGLLTLWTVLATLPFMVIIQRMAGRIGLVSGKGLAGNMKRHYPLRFLVFVTVVISVANIVNIGANISAIAAAIEILTPLPALTSAVILSLAIILLMTVLPYRTIAKYLKWVALVMFSYVLAGFFVAHPWGDIVRHTLVPHWSLDKEYLAMIVAIFGTTISPYLFFWQASEAVEEERAIYQEAHPRMIPTTHPTRSGRPSLVIKNEISAMYTDVRVGMIFSNLITFFIIILASSTLFANGLNQVRTIEEMAAILEPLVGQYSYILFLVGILASGILAIPVLAGSAAYAIAETVGWKEGLDHTFTKARQFYIVIIIATLLGIAIPALGLQPVNILYYTGIMFGIVAPLIILLVVHMANNPKIMGNYTSRHWSNIVAYGLFVIMTASIIFMFL